ncbi:MAG TPA: hypothetical protein DF296_03360 [Candidatus Margulisbacteria bacterium]|nr:MAG: hypothetical protein A2X43_04645 [Candidatus Margulisbacteria bacterium GWD2_39_127]OGI01568.1 MAG: hypothetical protein A2X42_08305 [Candidatus Margulisbacteria bacterium GWF2_38_17]OGI10009.1 MAG: hypothetical protein A2X41_09015 [Candidatus Margulisbacteria bacterium GWE2_39_32]HAR61848.1 hypothetical protein [Candidatus Margulisiibacteriota bacterium]HCT84218.1 hypothetical protein [Candidatus Margulisiibacteriota bacterium]
MLRRLFIFLWVFLCFTSGNGNTLEFKPNIDGVKEWKLGNKYVRANNDARKHIQDHPYYKLLPSDLYEGSLYWKERLNLKIDGRLDSNLYVRYDIEEESDFPSKHNIFVQFYNHEFTFGDFEPQIVGGPFATVNKKINGFMYTSKDDKYSAFATVGEERSDTDIFLVNGDGVNKVYKMRYNPIVEGSLKVYINNEKLQEGKDYTVNYINYNVTLEDARSVKDVIKFVYDYTNPVEDFISIDRQQFKAARMSFMMDAETDMVRNELKTQEFLDIESKTDDVTNNTAVNYDNGTFTLANKYILTNSETIYFNERKLAPAEYMLDYANGIVKVPPRVWDPFDKIRISYSYYEHGESKETFAGVGTIGPYPLKNKEIVKGSESVILNKNKLKIEEDYFFNYAKGAITFRRPVSGQDNVEVNYVYYALKLPAQKKPKYNWFSGGMTYLQKRAKSKESTITVGADNEVRRPSASYGRTVVYKADNWPIKEESLRILVNDKELSVGGVSINYDSGIVTVNYDVASYNNGVTNDLQSLDVIQAGVKFSYQYYRPKGPLTYSFYGNDKDSKPAEYTSLNKSAQKYVSAVPYNIKVDRDLDGGLISLRHKPSAGSFDALSKYGKDYEIVYEQDDLGRYSGQIGVVIYKRYQSPEDGIWYGYALSEDDVFEVKYSYVIRDAADPGFFQHDIVATDVHMNFDDRIRVNLDAAYSTREFERGIESNSVGATINGTGQYNSTYQLPHPDIVKGSEWFSKDGVRKSLEPGMDYYINYAKGELKFIGFAPNAQDNYRIYYDYYTQAASGTKKRNVDKGVAAQLDTTYTDDKLSLTGEYSSVDKSFTPYAGTNTMKVPVGSTQWRGNIKYKVLSSTDVYYDKKETKTQSGELQGDPIYRVTREDKYGAVFSPAPWLFADGYINMVTDVTDKLLVPAITENTHTIDDRSAEKGIKVTFGPEYLSTKIAYIENEKETGYVDKYQNQLNTTKVWEIKNTFIPVNNVNLQSEYGFSKVYARDEGRALALSSDRRRYYGTALQSSWFGSISLEGKIKITNVDYISSYNVQGEAVSTNRDKYELKDTSYSVIYTPQWEIDMFKHLRAQYQEDHSEQDGLALSQKGKISNNRTYSLQLSPYGLRCRYNGRGSDSEESNGNILRNYNSNQYDISSFSPVSWVALNNISQSNNKSHYRSYIVQDASANMTDSSGKGFSYSYLFTPLPNIRYNNSYAQESNKEHQLVLKYATSNTVTTDKPKFSQKNDLYIKLPEIGLTGLTGISVMDMLTLGDSDLSYVVENSEEKTVVDKRYYPSQNLSIVESTEQSRSVSNTFRTKMLYNVVPFRTVKSSYLYDKIDNFIITQRTDKTNDTVRNSDETKKVNMLMPLITNLTLETSWTGNSRKEWENRNTTENLSSGEVLNDFSKRKATKNEEYLTGLQWAAISNVDFKMSGIYSRYEENRQEMPATFNNLFYKKYSIVPGAIIGCDKIIYQMFRVNIGKMTLGYNHYFDFISEKGKPSVKGFRSLLTLDYVPFQINNVKGTATYKRNTVWGTNTNEAQQQKDISTGGNTEDTVISRQNYLEQEGKIDLEILVPINGLLVKEVVNNIKINLSAILVESKDYIQNNSSKNYYLWSLLGNVAINF